MNWITKNKKRMQRVLLLSGVAAMVVTACDKVDEDFRSNVITDHELKGSYHSFASEIFDEVMEIGDQGLDMYEMFLYGFDSTNGHGYIDGDNHYDWNSRFGSHRGMGGMGHLGGNGFYDSIMQAGGHVNFDDFRMMGESMEFGDHYFRLSECAEISRVQDGESTVTIVDFGEDNCESFDGKLRRGKIMIDMEGDYWNGDANVIFSFDNYYVDDNRITGTKTVEAFINEDGNRENRILDEGKIILTDQAGTISWNAQKTRVVISGSDTFYKVDDVIELTGVSSGILADGNTFESETQTPLIRKYNMHCRGVYISGITAISIGDGTEIVIDYGDGTCDNIAEITTDGMTETIDLDDFGYSHGYGDCGGDHDGDEDGDGHRHGRGFGHGHGG